MMLDGWFSAYRDETDNVCLQSRAAAPYERQRDMNDQRPYRVKKLSRHVSGSERFQAPEEVARLAMRFGPAGTTGIGWSVDETKPGERHVRKKRPENHYRSTRCCCNPVADPHGGAPA
jgi:hypothetical protein